MNNVATPHCLMVILIKIKTKLNLYIERFIYKSLFTFRLQADTWFINAFRNCKLGERRGTIMTVRYQLARLESTRNIVCCAEYVTLQRPTPI